MFHMERRLRWIEDLRPTPLSTLGDVSPVVWVWILAVAAYVGWVVRQYSMG